jgi:hypothetical protein
MIHSLKLPPNIKQMHSNPMKQLARTVVRRLAARAPWGVREAMLDGYLDCASEGLVPARLLSVLAPWSCTAYPALTARHVRDARLYSDRFEMLRGFVLPPGEGVIGEVGVAVGTFSTFLIDLFKPQTFVAFDLFDLHTNATLWGQQTSVVLEGKTHYDFYRDRFASSPTRVVMEQGLSYETLAKYPDQSFDSLYIDAGHQYEDVKRDAENARTKIKADGILVFNDYIMFDHLHWHPYGVVAAVNELIVQDDWQVIGFALEQKMFCDIALRRSDFGPRM